MLFKAPRLHGITQAESTVKKRVQNRALHPVPTLCRGGKGEKPETVHEKESLLKGEKPRNLWCLGTQESFHGGGSEQLFQMMLRRKATCGRHGTLMRPLSLKWRRQSPTALAQSIKRCGHREQVYTRLLTEPIGSYGLRSLLYISISCSHFNVCTSLRLALAKQTCSSLSISTSCVNYYGSINLFLLIEIEILETGSLLPPAPGALCTYHIDDFIMVYLTN